MDSREFKLSRTFGRPANGCLCDSPNNSLKQYDDSGCVGDIQLVITHGDVVLFNRGMSMGWLNASYCPLCGRKLEKEVE